MKRPDKVLAAKLGIPKSFRQYTKRYQTPRGDIFDTARVWMQHGHKLPV